MRELFRLVEDPRQCSYLPERNASLELRLVASMSAAEYGDLMARGYRRFGMQIFRPACAACQECRSMRVPVREFAPTRGQQRVTRRNRHVQTELCEAFATTEHAELFNLYHRFMHEHRGWPLQQVTVQSYYRDFVAGAAGYGKQWLYFDGSALVGVALMDEVPGAISLVYCFYHPEWRAQSPGTFSILNQIAYARAEGLDYAYLGYWVRDCQSLNYKARFGPYEILQNQPESGEAPVWLPPRRPPSLILIDTQTDPPS